MNVTKTFLPPIDDYTKYLQRAFDNVWLTNRGSLVYELESKLKAFLGVEYLTLTTNGTLPLQIAIKAMDLKGEIITTPFSYVATTTAIVWESCKPVFVDIEPEFLTIDATKIESAITENTSAILATHVFGNPCDVDLIERIANKYKIKVIYDAAHCFGVKYNGKSVFMYGDVSTCSFHATKIFHTGEGGCFIAQDEELHQKLYYHHNFGHKTATSFYGLGTNAKMSELQAAMGLAVYDYLDDIFDNRKVAVDLYDSLLDDLNIQKLNIRPGTEWNHHYYPILFDSEEQLIRVLDAMNKESIFPRRYFYPSLNKLSYVESCSMPVSESVSRRILCLPLYSGISAAQINSVVSILNKYL